MEIIRLEKVHIFTHEKHYIIVLNSPIIFDQNDVFLYSM